MTEIININIKQEDIIRFHLNVSDCILLKFIYDKNKEKEYHISGTYILNEIPAIFTNIKMARTSLAILKEEGLIKKEILKPDFGPPHQMLKVTGKGRKVCEARSQAITYSSEEYLNACQVISYWNSFKQLTTHSLKPYREEQSKTVDSCITFINSLIQGNIDFEGIKVRGSKITDNMREKADRQYSINDIKKICALHVKRFGPEYLPENKGFLLKSLNQFFVHYKTKSSDFFDIVLNGIQEFEKTIDVTKKTSISAPMLNKAYQTLSATGSATEQEKLEILKSVNHCHKNYLAHREEFLDGLYNWKKQYRERIMNFNIFIYELLIYIEKEVGKGNAKPGYISFRQGNKIMEGFSKYLVDQYSIHLWPTEKKIEQIKKSRLTTE